jgi:bifunctional UDP-N-acetylglucosamine pyrophosphorylase/glucosamine-1-phosphate N-acetyltransferase
LPTHVIVLAAGQGKRMKSDLPKVAHAVAGRSLIGWVGEAVAPSNPDSLVVVLGHGSDQVRPLLPANAVVAIQEEQLGTGHATKIGLNAVGELDDDDNVLVLYGDMPLLTPELISSLTSRESGVAMVMVTAEVDDPSGYGRLLREGGKVAGIVEDRDCTPDEARISEINAGIYSFQAGALSRALAAIGSDNAQGEEYLTDVIGILAAEGVKLEAVKAGAEEVIGINSQDQLAEAGQVLRRRINQGHMDAGVQIIDPDRTYIDADVEIAPGVTIYPGVHLEGSTTVGPNSQVGPDVFAVDSSIGEESLVWYSVLRSAVVGSHCEVGPYASLRAGTILADRAKVGTFVETKNTTLGEGAKAPHLTYLGDATVGSGTNIGAGTITCNFDGYEKHATVIGDDVFIGSDTMLVAPLTIGDRAITGAGSAITKDVEADALAIERSDQKVIPGYARRRAERQATKKAEE